MRAIGLMSGTSLDGVDAAVIDTDGERIVSAGACLTLPYAAPFRTQLRAFLDHVATDPDAQNPELEATLAERHADAVRALGETDAELIGFHGQTVLHRPADRRTRQIGDAALLARLTRLPVAHDFRLADVAAGGEGAPLAPVYHAALAASVPQRPLGVLNLGGVANLTVIDEAGHFAACDTGPGNALLDDWCAARLGTPMDRDGALARAGTPDEAVLETLLAHPFFARPAPKSLDRQDFAHALGLAAALSDADGAATLAAFTARAAARTPLPRPARVLVTGGGRHNPALMAALAESFGVTPEPAEAVGWNGDSLEAELMGFLAVRVLRELPLTFPSTTGIAAPLAGGRISSFSGEKEAKRLHSVLHPTRINANPQE